MAQAKAILWLLTVLFVPSSPDSGVVQRFRVGLVFEAYSRAAPGHGEPRDIGMLLPNNQRLHCTSHATKDVLPLRMEVTECRDLQNRSRANMAHEGRSRPGSGPGFQSKILDGHRVGWEGCRESRRCLRDTYPESYITKYTRMRR